MKPFLSSQKILYVCSHCFISCFWELKFAPSQVADISPVVEETEVT